MSTLFENYNARFSDLKTVGSTFVLREREFVEICGVGNTLILGPRGSGKTTLLKMMKIGAQIASKFPENYETLKSINYRPVYLQADRLFEALTKGIVPNERKFSPALASLSRSLTAIRTRFAFLDTLSEIVDPRTQATPVVSHQYVEMSRAQEVELCKLLCRAWIIRDDVINLKELRASLSGQIERINVVLDASMRLPGNNDTQNAVSSLISDPISSAIAFIDSFESVFPNKMRQWALCVDELEIMPDDLQQYFYLNLRSTDHRLILKIATSPFTAAFSVFDSGSPMDNNDYISVNLSDAKKKDSIKFTRRLVAEIVRRDGFSGSVNAKTILGKSPVTEENFNQAGRDGPYSAPRGAHYQRFKRLAEIDEGFREYLLRTEVNIEKLDTLEEASRAAKARQAIWQVALRLEYGANQAFRSSTEGRKRRNPRKKLSAIYAGADSMLAMCEGNPRITIGLFRTILREFRSNGEKKVSLSAQSAVLETTIAKYLSLLSAIPIRMGSHDNRNASVVTLLEKIGDVFGKANLVGNFSPESMSTLIVSEDLPADLVEALGAAINQGAFVMIEDKYRRRTYGRLQGARLRLSYLLCPRYRLPLTYGRSTSLKGIVSSKSRVSKPDSISMNDLFDHHDIV